MAHFQTTWAFPVSITKLGAHLEAYAKGSSAILTLRLCHRFGQGPEVRINKLSLELVGMIEEEFLLPQREASYSEWDKAAKCWEGRCTRTDHMRSLGPKTYEPFMTDWSYQHHFDHDLLLDHELSCKSWMERFTKSPPVKSTDNQLALAEYDKV